MRFSPGHVKAALAVMRTNRWRSLLTMFGIIVGVASVIVIVGLSEGVKNDITAQVNNYSKNVISVTSRAGGGSSFGIATGPAVSTLTNKDVSAISKIKGVQAAVPLAVLSGVASGDQSYRGGIIIATNQDLPKVLNQTMAFGNFFNNLDANPYSAVLGASAAKALFKNPIPLGYSFTWRNQQFVVDGILNSYNSTPFSNNTIYNDAIFIPQEAARQLSQGSNSIYEILAKVGSSQQLSSTKQLITSKLTTTHDGQSDFSVLLPSQVAGNSTSILNLMTELIIGIAVIALFVGGVGIMNVMLVSVSERMHEIGIRKAIGASNRQIMSQFLIEATTVSISGGIIGVVVALMVDLGLRVATNLSPAINWQIIVLSAAASIVIGIIFGIVPAFKASRKEPIEALRND